METSFDVIPSEQLEDVDGARSLWGAAARIGTKFVPGVNWVSHAYSAYEASQAFGLARDRGHGFVGSAWEAAKAYAFGLDD
jgi:hypothetical protein